MKFCEFLCQFLKIKLWACIVWSALFFMIEQQSYADQRTEEKKSEGLSEAAAARGFTYDEESTEDLKSGELSERDERILDTGEIHPLRHGLGVLVAIATGPAPMFGIGQGIQGRFHESGWIFLAGEATSIGVLFVGSLGPSTNMSKERLLLLYSSLISYVGFRVWEIVDSIVGPINHNQRFHELEGLNSVAANVSLIPMVVAGGVGDATKRIIPGVGFTWEID